MQNDGSWAGWLRFPAVMQEVVEFSDVQASLSHPLSSGDRVQVHPGSSSGRNPGGPMDEGIPNDPHQRLVSWASLRHGRMDRGS